MPVRMLKDWTASERVDLLSPQAEVFFVRLIMKADDHGCFHGNPKLLNSLLFPLKEYLFSDVLTWRTECQKAGIIKVYTHEGQNYIQIMNFGQRLRTMNSKFPQPADNCQTNDSKAPPEEKRREEEVEEEENLKEKKVFTDTVDATLTEWEIWGAKIVNQEDQYWEQMKGRKISQEEMDSFLSVATRNDWKMETQQQFRTALKGFKTNNNHEPNKTTSGSTRPQHFEGKQYNTQL
ncbi:MAG TPA: hypothetical protein VL443_30065 [Cyclobacteriaceae bacterium]|jgi:hypothetical protein|nr:hypothetical protein [Cyclobacteriaceae bacterium]